MEKFRVFLKSKLQEKGDQRALAKALGVNPITISRWLHKDQTPEYTALIKMAIHFSMDPMEILSLIRNEHYIQMFKFHSIFNSKAYRVTHFAGIIGNRKHARVHESLQKILESNPTDAELVTRLINRFSDRPIVTQ
jgi:hypothetical protein